MNRQRELEILELMRLKEQDLWSMMQTLPHGGTQDELITPSVELMELRSELDHLRSEPSGWDEPDALVGAPLKPRPHLNSGAVALPEPDDGEV